MDLRSRSSRSCPPGASRYGPTDRLARPPGRPTASRSAFRPAETHRPPNRLAARPPRQQPTVADVLHAVTCPSVRHDATGRLDRVDENIDSQAKEVSAVAHRVDNLDSAVRRTPDRPRPHPIGRICPKWGPKLGRVGRIRATSAQTWPDIDQSPESTNLTRTCPFVGRIRTNLAQNRPSSARCRPRLSHPGDRPTGRPPNRPTA